ncbi:hypothetical protein N6P31_09690 [Pectobacterium betavasculorum]|uniref:hypothetical protein n=1 Tax=Pectobacterium betavasculorum TaxID=55207 RepID=UPI00313C44B8
MRRFIMSAGLVLGVVALLGLSQLSAAQVDGGAGTAKPVLVHEGLNSPVGMAYDGSGNLYVANWSAGTVLRFSQEGRRTVFASGLPGPSGLAISPQGDIYVASYSEDLVWRFTSGGDRSIFVRDLATPAGLSFDARGRLLIANRRTNQILAAHPDGKIDVVAEGLQTPVGAVELANGDLMVSNIAGGISIISGGQRARTINGDLRSPGPGIVRAGDDAAYVVDYGGTTISRIDRNGHRTIVAEGLSSPVGLALAPDGTLTAATWGANATFRIVLPKK